MSDIEKAKQEIKKWEQIRDEAEAQINRGHWSPSVERRYSRAQYQVGYLKQGLSYIKQGADYGQVSAWASQSAFTRMNRGTPIPGTKYFKSLQKEFKSTAGRKATPEEIRQIERKGYVKLPPKQEQVIQQQKQTPKTYTAYKNPFTGEIVTSNKPIPGWSKIKVSAGMEVKPTGKEVLLEGYSGTQYTPTPSLSLNRNKVVSAAPVFGYQPGQYNPKKDISFWEKTKSAAKEYASFQPQRQFLSKTFGTGSAGRPSFVAGTAALFSPLQRYFPAEAGSLSTQRYYGGTGVIKPDKRIDVPYYAKARTGYEQIDEGRFMYYGGGKVTSQRIIDDLIEEKVKQIEPKYQDKLQKLYDEGKLTPEEEEKIQKQYQREVEKEVMKEYKKYEPEVEQAALFTQQAGQLGTPVIDVPKIAGTAGFIGAGLISPFAVSYEGYSSGFEGVAKKRPVQAAVGFGVGTASFAGGIIGVEREIMAEEIKREFEEPFKVVGVTKRREGSKEFTELVLKKRVGVLESEGTLRQVSDIETGTSQIAGIITTKGKLSWDFYSGSGTGFVDRQLISSRQLTGTISSGKTSASFSIQASGTKGASTIFNLAKPQKLKINFYEQTAVNSVGAISKQVAEDTYAFISGDLKKVDYIKAGDNLLIQADVKPRAYGFVKDITGAKIPKVSSGGGAITTQTTKTVSPFVPSTTQITKTVSPFVPSTTQITKTVSPFVPSTTQITKTQTKITPIQKQEIKTKPTKLFTSKQVFVPVVKEQTSVAATSIPPQKAMTKIKPKSKAFALPFIARPRLITEQKPKTKVAVTPVQTIAEVQKPRQKQKLKTTQIEIAPTPFIARPPTAVPRPSIPRIPIIPPGFDFRLGGGRKRKISTIGKARRKSQYTPTLASIFTGFESRISKGAGKRIYTGFEVFRPVPKTKFKSVFI